NDPVVTFLLVLAIGIVAGVLFDRLAGPSWLARQFARSTRGIVTSALVGVAGAFVGYHIAVLLALGGGLVTSVIAAAAGAAVVLFAWRLARGSTFTIRLPRIVEGAQEALVAKPADTGQAITRMGA